MASNAELLAKWHEDKRKAEMDLNAHFNKLRPSVSMSYTICRVTPSAPEFEIRLQLQPIGCTLVMSESGKSSISMELTPASAVKLAEYLLDTFGDIAHKGDC